MMRDPLAYAESFGNVDRRYVKEALQGDGTATVLRVCLSPKERVPLRTLGLIAAAQEIQAYIPDDTQLQIVIPQHTIAEVNGVKIETTREAADRLVAAHAYIPPIVEPTFTVDGKRMSSTIFAVDKPVIEAADIDIEYLAKSLRDTKVAQKLQTQAARRGRDLVYGGEAHLYYLAGHVRMHDIADSVNAYFPEQQAELLQAERIISIGSKESERAFYLGRMAYRAVAEDSRLVPETGQIFTHHVLPPYQPRRQPHNSDRQLFDPMLEELHELENPLITRQYWGYRDTVVRDLQHLRMYMKARDSLGSLAVEPSISQLLT
jgi:hypothetical protein